MDENAFLFNHETRQREQLTGIYGSNQKADAYVYFGKEGWQMLEDPKSSPECYRHPLRLPLNRPRIFRVRTRPRMRAPLLRRLVIFEAQPKASLHPCLKEPVILGDMRHG